MSRDKMAKNLGTIVLTMIVTTLAMTCLILSFMALAHAKFVYIAIFSPVGFFLALWARVLLEKVMNILDEEM